MNYKLIIMSILTFCAVLSLALLVYLAFHNASIDARKYGVKADGITDDSAAMQKAVDAAVRTGKPLHLPPGSINLGTKTLEWGAGPIHIEGEKGETTILYRGTGTALRGGSSGCKPGTICE